SRACPSSWVAHRSRSRSQSPSSRLWRRSPPSSSASFNLSLMADTETSSPEETAALAAALAKRLAPGDVVTVAGELGSGKTTFVRGACEALGVREHVTSPTYTIGPRYQGDGIEISHLDLFRFEGVSHVVLGDLQPL